MGWRRSDGTAAVLPVQLSSSDPISYTDARGQSVYAELPTDFPTPVSSGAGSNIFPGTKPGVGVISKPTEATTQDVFDEIKALRQDLLDRWPV